MKKSLLNIITLALVAVNLILSIVMIFSVLPTSSKTNKMVTQVCTALNLELESSKTGDASDDITIDQMETFDVEDELTIPLKKGEDNVEHYAVVSVAIVVNNKHKDYAKYQDTITEKESLIKDAVNSTIGNFTIQEMESGQAIVQDAVLKKLQKLFNSDFIVKVAFKKCLFQ